MGVSADKLETQFKFVEKFGLRFPMVPNPEKDIIEAYGALKVLGVAAQRSTFLINPEGHIAYVWPKVSVLGHSEEAISKLRELSGQE